ncbi:MAG: hypothetical protein ABSC19_18500 [Syntrophorhabdales bacterium]|jgi:hypothetical protein
MRYLAIALLTIMLVSCSRTGVVPKVSEDKVREYSVAAVALSDFSIKIVAYYRSKNESVPGDFDTSNFFALLQTIYPDQNRVNSIKGNYRVSVRPLDGGYSVMLCDPRTDRKIMEDFSCHVSRVELRSWESDVVSPCVFENNWKAYCEP